MFFDFFNSSGFVVITSFSSLVAIILNGNLKGCDMKYACEYPDMLGFSIFNL